MRILSAVASSLGLVGLIYTIIIMARLSQRLGAVTKMRPLYRGLYLAAAFILVPLIVHFLRLSTLGTPPEEMSVLRQDWCILLFYSLPMAIGMTVSLVITWRYWSWLLRERSE